MSSTVSTQTKNRVVTIYLAGTGNTQQTSKQNEGPSGRYPNGELISILASNDKGKEGSDWFFVRGLGGRAKNGGREETFPESGEINESNHSSSASEFTEGLNDSYDFLNDIQTAVDDNLEKMFGSYWNYKVDKIIRDLKTVIAASPDNPPAAINLTGWSRGGVTANMVANAMLRDPALRDLAVNIMVFDPVPGAGLGHHNDANKAFTGKNVKNYQVYFARDDRSRAFVPLMPKTHPDTEVKVAVVPGDHGTGAGRVRALEEGPNETGPEVGLLVRDDFEKQLTAWGSRFNNKLELTPESIQTYRAQVKKDNAAYVQLGTRTRYLVLQEQSHGTHGTEQGADRCVRYGNDQGHQGHDDGHAHGHTTFDEMMATKGFTAVNGGSFLDGGSFIKQPGIAVPLPSREECIVRHKASFSEFMGNLSLYLDSRKNEHGRYPINLLKLRIKEGSQWYERTVGAIKVRYEESVDGAVFNSWNIKKNIIKNLDFSLNNFLHNANPDNYFLDKYKHLWGEDLNVLKGEVADAVTACLIADAIDSFRPMNRMGEQVGITNLPAIKEELVSIAEKKTASVVSSLAYADYSAYAYRRLDNHAGEADNEHERQLAVNLLAQDSAQMLDVAALMGNNLIPAKLLTGPLTMNIVASSFNV